MLSFYMRNITKEDKDAITDIVCNTRESMKAVVRHLWNLCPEVFCQEAVAILKQEDYEVKLRQEGLA